MFNMSCMGSFVDIFDSILEDFQEIPGWLSFIYGIYQITAPSFMLHICPQTVNQDRVLLNDPGSLHRLAVVNKSKLLTIFPLENEQFIVLPCQW